MESKASMKIPLIYVAILVAGIVSKARGQQSVVTGIWSQGMLESVSWLQPDPPGDKVWRLLYEEASEPGDGWLTKRGKARADIVLKLVYHYRSNSSYRMIILRDGSAFSWRTTPMAIQDALSVTEKFTPEGLSALSKLDEETRLENLDGGRIPMAHSVLIGKQQAGVRERPVQIARFERLPKALRAKLAVEFGLPDKSKQEARTASSVDVYFRGGILRNGERQGFLTVPWEDGMTTVDVIAAVGGLSTPPYRHGVLIREAKSYPIDLRGRKKDVVKSGDVIFIH